MLRTKTCCAALASLLLASSCAAPMASTMPAAKITEPTMAEIAEGVAPVEFHGIPGLFFTFEAWQNVLIKQRLQLKDIEITLASESVAREIAETEAAKLRAHAAALDWRATWGPPLAFAGGITVAGVVALIVSGVLGGLKHGR